MITLKVLTPNISNRNDALTGWEHCKLEIWGGEDLLLLYIKHALVWVNSSIGKHAMGLKRDRSDAGMEVLGVEPNSRVLIFSGPFHFLTGLGGHAPDIPKDGNIADRLAKHHVKTVDLMPPSLYQTPKS